MPKYSFTRTLDSTNSNQLAQEIFNSLGYRYMKFPILDDVDGYIKIKKNGLDYIDIVSDITLSSGEQTTLNNIITSHVIDEDAVEQSILYENDPDSTYDSTKDFVVGDEIITTAGKLWKCISAVESQAVWVEVTNKYSQSEIDGFLSGKANSSHNHNVSDISDFDTGVDNVISSNSDINSNTSHRQITSGNPHQVTKSDVGLGNVTNDAQIPLSQKGVAGGVSSLDGSGKVPTSQLPSQALRGSVYVVADVTARDALTGLVEGDECKVEDDGSGDPAYYLYDGTQWVDWNNEGGSGGAVDSVNGETGIVVLDTDDIDEGTSNKYFTEQRVRDVDDVSNNTSHRQTTSGNPHQVTKSEVGLGNVHNKAQLYREANDFNSFSEKTTLNNDDKLLIEDSENSYNKKHILIKRLRRQFEIQVGNPNTNIYTSTWSEWITGRNTNNGIIFGDWSGWARNRVKCQIVPYNCKLVKVVFHIADCRYNWISGTDSIKMGYEFRKMNKDSSLDGFKISLESHRTDFTAAQFYESDFYDVWNESEIITYEGTNSLSAGEMIGGLFASPQSNTAGAIWEMRGWIGLFVFEEI